MTLKGYYALCLKNMLEMAENGGPLIRNGGPLEWRADTIGVGDGGQVGTCPPPEFGQKYIFRTKYIFFGQKSCKIRAFCYFFRAYHVKFGNFVNFSGKYHVKFGHFVNFSCIYFRAKMFCSPKVDWAPTLMADTVYIHSNFCGIGSENCLKVVIGLYLRRW